MINNKEDNFIQGFSYNPLGHLQSLQISGGLQVKLALRERESLSDRSFVRITLYSAHLSWGKLLSASPALDSCQEWKNRV